MGIFTKHPYIKKYYITHPIKFFKHYYYDLKAGYQRATKGYSFRDLGDIDHWFLNVFPNMLKEFNEVRYGYPGDITDEEWKKIINEMIFYFQNANSETTDFVNIYEEDYNKLMTKEFDESIFKKIDEHFTQLVTPERNNEEKLLAENFYHQEEEKRKYMYDNLKNGFDLWYKWFGSLWD